MAVVAIRRRPLLRWITLIGMLVAVPVAYFVMQMSRNAILLDLNERAQEALKVELAYLQSRIDSLHTVTRIVGTDERVITFLENPDDTDRLRQVNHYLSRLHVTAGSIAYIINPQGNVLASGNWEANDSFVGRNLGFRPYFKSSVMGETAHYVAIGTISNRLGFYVSMPIRIEGKVAGVAVTKTDPHDLVLPYGRDERPFFITDTSGVAIISRPRTYLFHRLTSPDTDSKEDAESQYRFLDREIKPITEMPIENLQKVRIITLPAIDASNPNLYARKFVLAQTAVPAIGWKAYILWPIHGLSTILFQRVIIALLAMIVTWLMTIFVVERWRHMKQMHEQAFRDPLTRLYSRLYMLESATSLLAAHDRDSIPGVGAIMFDLDHFKRINDRYGHSAGDSVLVKVAGVLIKECRESDIPIRYGGEEFLIFVPTHDRQQILQLAERIRLQVRRLDISLAGRAVHLTITGGIATHLRGESLEKLIDRADQMMYDAKQNGRDQICSEPNCLKGSVF